MHTKCEEVIAQTLEKKTDIRSKKQKAAHVRWEKERARKLAQAKNSDEDACAYAGAEQMQSTCNAGAMLTNNHKPITKNISNTNKQLTHTEAVEASSDESVACVSSHEDCFDEGEDFDAPVRVQAEQKQLEHLQDTVDETKPLTLVELITACKTFGIRLSHTPKTEAIANRNTVTLSVLRECAKTWKATSTGTGYFVGILDNASKDPQSILPHEKREKPELSAETISDKQAGYFASRLVKDTSFCSTFGVGHQSFDSFIDQVTRRLHDPAYFNEYLPWMQKHGFV